MRVRTLQSRTDSDDRIGGASRVKFHLLGPLRVEHDGVEVDIGGPKQRLLLAALLLAESRTVSVDRLIDLLWGESPRDRAQPTLHVYVAKLRKALSHPDETTGMIETVRPGYRVHVDSSNLDLIQFRSLSNEAREAMAMSDLERASGRFTEALALPKGPLLADLADEEFVLQEAYAFESTLLSVTADAYHCEIQLGRHGEVLGDLQRLTSGNPLDERLRYFLMLALYRSGRQVDALATYADLRETLAEELGIEPGPEVQDLELKVLNHDPVLAAPRFRSLIDDAPPTVTRSSRVASGAFLDLEGEEMPMSRLVTTIGRLPNSDVVIRDPDASRVHAEVRRTGQGYILIDLGSTNGTSVNGHIISTHLLESGDKIEIGDVEFRFRQS